MSTAKKKRRRSSLAATKNKLEFSPGTSLGKALHGQIDNSLPPEERLAQLTNLCLKCAVDRVSCETESQDVKDQLEKVLGEIPAALDKPDVKAALHRACHAGSLLPNALNIEMEETSKEIEARIARLKQEEQEWQAHFQDLETKITEAERREGEKTLAASELTSTQRELSKDYLPVGSDLALVRQQATDATNKAHILVCEHEKNCHILSRMKTEINNRLDKKLRSLHEKSVGFIGSPKARIQNLIEFPTPPSEPVHKPLAS